VRFTGLSHFVGVSERGAELWAKWRTLVSEQQASGQSVAAFCHARGMTSSQMFAWKKRLREAEAARFVALELSPVAEAKWPLIHSRAIEVRLDRGRSLVVEPGFDAHHLRALLSVLEEA
jgi:transposase-like protein